MIITRHGKNFLKVQVGDTVIAVNPVSKDSNEKSSKFGASIALISINHEDTNGINEVSFGEKVPFYINGPGEYEIKNIIVRGVASKSQYDGSDFINTIYVANIDGMNVCFFGLSTDTALSEEAKEVIEEVDVLFMPVSEKGLKASDGYKIAVALEPKIIIPLGNTDNDEKQFCKQAGEEKPEVVEKITIKKKDLDGKSGDIFILKY